jgi:hypothetical protein
LSIPYRSDILHIGLKIIYGVARATVCCHVVYIYIPCFPAKESSNADMCSMALDPDYPLRRTSVVSHVP